MLLALLIMTLVATLAAGMVWLQWRGIEVETAERARAQAEWLLNASLDWGNLILKSSIRNGHTEDDLGQPWATPLEETKLSSFLSADGNHSDDSGPEAYLSGQITDARVQVQPVQPRDPDQRGRQDSTEINRLQILLHGDRRVAGRRRRRSPPACAPAIRRSSNWSTSPARPTPPAAC